MRSTVELANAVERARVCLFFKITIKKHSKRFTIGKNFGFLSTWAFFIFSVSLTAVAYERAAPKKYIFNPTILHSFALPAVRKTAACLKALKSNPSTYNFSLSNTFIYCSIYFSIQSLLVNTVFIGQYILYRSIHSLLNVSARS